jgi:hypothetical protein
MSGDDRIPEFRIEKYCLDEVESEGGSICKSYLTTETNDDETVTVWRVTIGKKGIPSRSRLDVLPSRMAYATDPLSGESKYIALRDGVIIVMASDYDAFIDKLRQYQQSAVAATGRLVQYYKLFIPSNLYYPLYPGVYEDGFHDPRGFLDETDYGIDPLIKAIEWARAFYDEPNDRHAAFLIISAVGKVITPIIRFNNGTFVDQLVWAHGKGGVGKSTTVDRAVRPLLGVPLGMGEKANKEHHIVLTISHFSTPNQIRNLLDENYLPLIIDEQQAIRIYELLPPIIASTVGIGQTGVHAAKYGQGIGAQFMSRRGWIIVANVSPNDFVRKALDLNATDEAAVRRRIINDEWAPIIIDRDEWEERLRKAPIPDLMPIYGFMGRLWVRYKEKLRKTATFMQLLNVLVDVMEQEYTNDVRVKKTMEYLRDTLDKVENQNKYVVIMESTEESFVRMAMEFARKYNFTPVNRITALLALLTVPGAVYPTAPKDEEKLVELIQQAEKELDELKKATYNDPNIDKLFNIAYTLLSERKPILLIPKDGAVGVIYGSKFLGERSNTYSVNGRKITAFPVPLHHLFELFLTAPTAEVSENGDKPKSGEDVRIIENAAQPEVNEPQVNSDKANGENGEESGEKPEEVSERGNEAKSGSGEGPVFWVEEAGGDYVKGIVEEVVNQVWARWPGVSINDVVEAIVKYIASADKEIDVIDVEKAFYSELASRLRNAGIRDDELPKVTSDIVRIIINVLKDRGGLDG